MRTYRCISPHVGASAIAGALGGARRSGAGWLARCPAHKDRTPSLSIAERDSMLLIHCHAGCPQDAVIAALRSRGLWPETPRPTWTPAERRAWARQRRADERDMPAARWFAGAAAALAETVLEQVGLCYERETQTVLRRLLRSDAGVLSEYRAWRRQHRRLVDAMVTAARKNRYEAQRQLLTLLEDHAAI